MNMNSYQLFIKTHQMLSSMYRPAKSVSDISTREYYLKKGITNEDVMVQMENSHNSRKMRELDMFLQTCQVYEIEEKHKYLLMLTKNPNMDEKQLWQQVRMPFPEIFLDLQFESSEIEDGINNVTIHGILIKEFKQIEPIANPQEKKIVHLRRYGLDAYVCGTNNGSLFIEKANFPITNEVNQDEFGIEVLQQKFNSKIEKTVYHFVKKFIINFILFLKDREVTYSERVRNTKNNTRRKEQNKMILPNSKIIKLTGELKRYVDSIQDHEFKGKFNHRFWVSGHWRTYKSERYKTLKNKVQWIEPFKKGQGIEVKKIRRIVPEDEDNTLNFADIKEANFKLREARGEN